MINPKGKIIALQEALVNVQETRDSLEALNEDISQRNSDLLSVSSDSCRVQESLQGLNHDVLSVENENSRFSARLQVAIDKLLCDENKRTRMTNEMKCSLEKCKNKIAVIAEAIGIDASDITITEKNQLQITLPDSKLTKLVFESIKNKIHLKSMVPPPQNLELLQMLVEASGDPIGLVLFMYTACS